MTYEEICEYIYKIPKFTKKNSLAHTKELMRRLKNPQDSFAVIHVAGSNGKGSVCAFISSILREAGFRTGLFTSPHLVCMEERFCIDGKNCSREDFVWAYGQVRQAVAEMQEEKMAHPSFFEYLFAMGMVIFKKKGVKYLVLETGLGGRLDATNIFSKPLLTVITSISLEHTEILGDTIEKIAAEKAGIIKERVPVIFDGNNSDASAVIRERARQMGAPFCEITLKNIKIREITGKKIDFCYRTGYDVVELSIPFVAEYQVMNAAVAYAASCELPAALGISQAQRERGLAKTRWPGRMQEAAERIYFDGAHNMDGIRLFLQTVKEIGGERPMLLFSMVREKDYHSVVHLLAGDVDWGEVVLTKIPDERGLEPELLREEFSLFGRETTVIYDCKDAYAYAVSKKAKGQYLFCSGSLYLIGELEKQDQI